MLRRVILGLVFGLAIGAALAFGLIRLGEVSFGGAAGDVLAYLSAAVAGALTGAVAGKPIWASGAKIEAGLKAAFGALMGAGAMFALRRWAEGFEPNLSAIGAGGPAPIGELPAASLPVLAAVLGAFFGLDNNDEPKNDERMRKRVPSGASKPGSKARIAEAEDGEESELASRRAKR